MSDLLSELREQPLCHFDAGDTVIAEGASTGLLYFLVEGVVEVTKNGVSVTRTNEPGAVFGDLSALLGVPHTAEVKTLEPSRFRVVEDPIHLLESNPAISLHLCRLLARRLDGVNRYLVDLKQQFKGHDHLGMVDGMIDLLLHRHPRERVRPPRVTLRDPELAE
jgi:CRP/FNR family cyclic AMP-dependent transcriptional regulator